MNPTTLNPQNKIPTQQTDVVICSRCSKLHFADADTFVAFHDMVTVGLENGVIGPQPTVYCRYGKCAAETVLHLAHAFGVRHEIGYIQQ